MEKVWLARLQGLRVHILTWIVHYNSVHKVTTVSEVSDIPTNFSPQINIAAIAIGKIIMV